MALKCLVLQVVEPVLIPCLVSPVVVVDPCAERVEARAATVGEDGFAAIGQRADGARGLVEIDIEGLAAIHGYACGGLLDAHFANGLSVGGKALALGRCLHEQLLVGLHISGLCPGRVVPLVELHQELVVAVRVERALGQCRHDDRGVLAWCHAAHGELARRHLEAIGREAVCGIIVGEVAGVIVLVEDVERALGLVGPLHAYVLIHLLHLIVLRLGLHVAEDDAVHHELAVVGRVAEVAAIGEIALAVARVVVHRLVYPVPDGTAA